MATDEYGFSALPVKDYYDGYYSGYYGSGSALSTYGTTFWSATEDATEDDKNHALSWYLGSDFAEICRDCGGNNGNKDEGFSVRCLQD